MKIYLRTAIIAFALIFSLSACTESDGISSSGAGSTVSDGGTGSAQYAGTYNGSVEVVYKGDDVDGTDTLPATVVVNNNGTVTLTIDGESVNGVINGNKIEIGVKITRSENGATCKGNILVNATISGSSLSGPINGSAECKLLLLKSTADLSGSISASKA